ncbi:MAG TPA: hypothetical protein VFM98_15050 [Ramlibacter sp.]|uniref:hypothetical protein n=1 Tax=Ramlibacter sp. TaxID=1917967 RepID=UPI002D7FFE53|nr:hypothetical protein [Ramlibacter sp.]HET8746922.1 hypothetical protein [Ramlibacter sp.]
MRRREPPRRDWPEPPAGGPAPDRCYAPETLLVPNAAPGEEDERVRAIVSALPDGAGPLRRIGICNAAGAIYREVALHGPVQLLYFWAGLNALGYRQRTPEDQAFSKYWLLFGREGTERRPLDGGR